MDEILKRWHDKPFKSFQIRESLCNVFDVVFHDDVAGVVRYSPDTCPDRDEAIRQAAALEARNERPTHWPVAWKKAA